MKKIMIVLVLLAFAPAAFAQKDLSSWAVFRGGIVPGKRMVKTEVRGGSLEAFRLDYYLGVTFLADEQTVRCVAEKVRADAGPDVPSETETVGDLLTYALVQPVSAGRKNRYLCYQARPAEGGWKVTLLYLEGAATLDSLRSMFEKQ